MDQQGACRHKSCDGGKTGSGRRYGLGWEEGGGQAIGWGPGEVGQEKAIVWVSKGRGRGNNRGVLKRQRQRSQWVSR